LDSESIQRRGQPCRVVLPHQLLSTQAAIATSAKPIERMGLPFSSAALRAAGSI
jgi:hypothetical protein